MNVTHGDIILASFNTSRVERVIGHLPEQTMQRIHQCLKAALQLV